MKEIEKITQMGEVKTKYPNREECKKIMRDYGTPERVINHTEAVALIAQKIAERLKDKGLKLNIPLIVSSAYLHDIARTESKHDIKGALYLKKIGLPEVAEVIMNHTFHKITDNISEIDETDVLCLADRMTIEDRFVGPERRMEYIINKAVLKFGEEKRDELEEKAKSFVRYVHELEIFMGKRIEDLIPSSIKQY